MYRLRANQIGLVTEALLKLRDYASQYKWANAIDFDKACASVQQTYDDGCAYVVDGYLVLIDVIQPWYSNDKILQEWLVLKLEHIEGQSVDSIPPALLAIAKERGCKSVITADSSPVNIVAGAYQRAGFTPLTTSFFKVI